MTNVTVEERKFNGTATLEITVPDDVENEKNLVKNIAQKYFKDVHGTSPSRTVAEKNEWNHLDNRWSVMVADHSSGSLVSNKEYEV